MSNIGIPNQSSKIWHILDDISGLGAYFSKPIFALKPWVQAGRFEYNEPYNPKNFFSHLYRGQSHFRYGFSKGRWSRKTLKFWEVYLFIHWNDISHGQNQRPNFLQIGTPYYTFRSYDKKFQKSTINICFVIRILVLSNFRGS